MQIDNLYFSVQFIVVDTALVSNARLQMPVILGQPFLAQPMRLLIAEMVR